MQDSRMACVMDTNYNNWIPDYAMDTIEGKLLSDDLWKKFHKIGTEMIITKTGRRMFPALRVEVSGLDQSANYCVFLEFVPTGNSRYKYSSGKGWVPFASDDYHNFNYRYLHPDSPASGSHWMSQAISFGRVKLTNTVVPHAGRVVLSSMHKYQPRIVFVKTHDPARASWINRKTMVFPETEFIAVTAYQNEEITRLKIDHNPFAKGFRENGHAKSKRRAPQRNPEEDAKRIDIIEIMKNEKSDSCDSVDFPESASSSPTSRTAINEERLFNVAPAPVTCYPNYYPIYNFSYRNYEYSALPPQNYQTGPYYSPYADNYIHPWSYAYNLNMASPLLPVNVPEKSKDVKPKKLTDFSIRAITGL